MDLIGYIGTALIVLLWHIDGNTLEFAEKLTGIKINRRDSNINHVMADDGETMPI